MRRKSQEERRVPIVLGVVVRAYVGYRDPVADSLRPEAERRAGGRDGTCPDSRAWPDVRYVETPSTADRAGNRPSPKCLHDWGRLQSTREDSRRLIPKRQLQQPNALAPKGVRHQPVLFSAWSGPIPAASTATPSLDYAIKAVPYYRRKTTLFVSAEPSAFRRTK